MQTRRHVISLTAKGLAGLLTSVPWLQGCKRQPAGARKWVDAAKARPSAGSEQSSATSSGPVDWAGFIDALATLAEEQFSDNWDHEAYVEDVKGLMRLIDADDAKFAEIYDGYVDAVGVLPQISTAHDGGCFKVATLEFDAGDEIPLHNHPDMTGVILCLSGAIEIEAFDLLPATSADGKLLLRHAAQVRLRAGDFSTLTASSRNIHALVATEYTELLDVFTPPYDGERMKRFKWYERAELPVNGTNTFEAWET